MNKVPFYGANIVCIDDIGIKRILPQVKRPVITYGFSLEAMFRAEIVECSKINIFKLFYKANIKDNEICLGEFKLAQPGQHNILNACAAIAVGIEMGIDLDKCKTGLAKFSGVGRRFEYKGQYKNIDIIDDYGHHPAEIIATIKTAKNVYPNKRIVIAFQPHRFSRTQVLFGDFCNAFNGVDRLLLAEIYPASEKPIPGVNSQNLAQGIMQVSKVEVSFHPNLDEIVETLKNELQENDLLISLGAGNITSLAGKLME